MTAVLQTLDNACCDFLCIYGSVGMNFALTGLFLNPRAHWAIQKFKNKLRVLL